MIHEVYIIHNSGICIFHRRFTRINTENQLVAGFLIALSQFSQEITQQKAIIDHIDLKGFKFICSQLENLTFALLANDYDREDSLYEMLEKLKSVFLERYHWEYRDFLNFSEYFKDFIPIVDEICRSSFKIVLLSDKETQQEDIMETLREKCNLIKSDKKILSVKRFYFPNIPHCEFSMWRVNLLENKEKMISLLQNSELIYLIINSRLKEVLGAIEIIKLLKEKVKHSKLVLFALGQDSPEAVKQNYIQVITGIQTTGFMTRKSNPAVFDEQVISSFLLDFTGG